VTSTVKACLLVVTIETVKKSHKEEEEIAREGKLRECLITENDSELLLKEKQNAKTEYKVYLYTLYN